MNEEEKLTYGELWSQSERLAARIQSEALTDASPIIVYGHMKPVMAVSFLACVKAGHPYIPVDVSIPADRILKIINSSKAELLLNNSGTSVDTGDALISVVEPGVLEGDGVPETDPGRWVHGEDTFTLSTHPEAREIQKACKSQPITFRASQIGSRMTFRWKAAKCS